MRNEIESGGRDSTLRREETLSLASDFRAKLRYTKSFRGLDNWLDVWPSRLVDVLRLGGERCC